MNAAVASVAIAAPLEGGFYAGRYLIEGRPYALIVAPKALGEHRAASWIARNKDVPGSKSFVDGLANTRAMADAGSKLAAWALSLTIGGYTDWYLGAQDESELAYRAFKPTPERNSLWGRSGINVSADPPTYPYTLDLPTQTQIPEFQAGGAEAFEAEGYWTSTQHASYSNYAWYQHFNNGNQYYWLKDVKLRARAVRRLPL